MPIPFTCQCGKKLSVKDELAGKRVRCPGCQQIINVPVPRIEEPLPEAVVEEVPLPLKSVKEESLAEAAFDDEPAPLHRKKKKRGGRKSNVALYVSLGAGALLLMCCCPISGGGVWFFFLRDMPEKKIIGTWKLRVPGLDTSKKGLNFADAQKRDFAAQFQVEFRKDGTATFQRPGAATTAKWKVLSSKENIVMVESIDDTMKVVEKIEITVIDDDNINIKAGNDKFIYLKRAK